MDIHIHIGEFVLNVQAGHANTGAQAVVNVVTPWFDGGLKTGYDRTKSLQVCVVCGHTKATCECEDPVYMSAADVSESLTVMHTDMVGHLVGEDDDEDD